MVESRDAVTELNDFAEAHERLDRERIELLADLKDLVAVAGYDLLRQTAEGRDAVRLLRRIAPEFHRDCGL